MISVDNLPEQIHWDANLFDGCTMNIAYDSSRYYLSFTHGDCASRGQVSTVGTVNMDDYDSLETLVWCSPTSVFMQGLISNRNSWVHGSTYLDSKEITGSATNPTWMKYDFSNLTGNYYIALQKLLTTGASGFCNVNEVVLRGTTYSLDNPS